MIKLVIAFIVMEIGGFIISTNWLSHIKEDLMVLGFNRNNMLGSGNNRNINSNLQNNKPKVGQKLIEGNAMTNGNAEMSETSAPKGGIFSRLSGRGASPLGKVAGGLQKIAGASMYVGGKGMAAASVLAQGAAIANKKLGITRKITGFNKSLLNGARYRVSKFTGSALGFVGKHANNAKNFISDRISEENKRKIKGATTKIMLKGQNAKYTIQKKAKQAYNWGVEKKEFIQEGLNEFGQFGNRVKDAAVDTAETLYLMNLEAEDMARNTIGWNIAERGRSLMLAGGLVGAVNAAGLSKPAVAEAIRRSRGDNYQIKGISDSSSISNRYTMSKEELKRITSHWWMMANSFRERVKEIITDPNNEINKKAREQITQIITEVFNNTLVQNIADSVAKAMLANYRRENTTGLAQNGQAISNGANPVNAIRYAESHNSSIKPPEIENNVTASGQIEKSDVVQVNPDVARNQVPAVTANQVPEGQTVTQIQTDTVTETVTTSSASQQRQTVASAQSSASSNSNTTSNVSQDTNIEEPIREPETRTSRVRSSTRRRTTTTVQSQASEPIGNELAQDSDNSTVIQTSSNAKNSRGRRSQKDKAKPPYLTQEMIPEDDKVIAFNPPQEDDKVIAFNPKDKFKGRGKSA